MERNRGFEVVSSYKKVSGVILPTRKTAKSAGYDIASISEVIIPPGEVAVLYTGLKAYMQDDEYLGIHVRSSVAIKRLLPLINAQGIIDADYYNNQDNEGHICIPLFNVGLEPQFIKKGERVAQGIFYKFLTADDDNASGERKGGLGSTGN